MAGFSEMVKINIHNSFTANVLPLLESAKFRAEQPSVSFAENKWLQFTVVHGKPVLFYPSLLPLNFNISKNLRQKLAIKSCRVHAQSVLCNTGYIKFYCRFSPKTSTEASLHAHKKSSRTIIQALGFPNRNLNVYRHKHLQNNVICNRLWFQEASVGLSENLGCRGTPATPTTEGTDLQQD